MRIGSTEDGQLVIKGIGRVIGVCKPMETNAYNNTGIQLELPLPRIKLSEPRLAKYQLSPNYITTWSVWNHSVAIRLALRSKSAIRYLVRIVEHPF